MRALVATGQFSLVTIAEQAPSDLLRMLGGSFQSHSHVPFRADTPSERNVLAARIDAAVTQADRAVLLVAHGAACFAAAWWARLSPSSYVSRVAGALLFAPADSGESFASPKIALPFPSMLVESAVPRLDVRALALGWGSEVVDAPAAGSPVRRAIERFTAAVVESKVRAAESLIFGRPTSRIR
jgi:pimeloyl-ACP methyl ester carboxylesterase